MSIVAHELVLAATEEASSTFNVLEAVRLLFFAFALLRMPKLDPRHRQV